MFLLLLLLFSAALVLFLVSFLLSIFCFAFDLAAFEAFLSCFLTCFTSLVLDLDLDSLVSGDFFPLILVAGASGLVDFPMLQKNHDFSQTAVEKREIRKTKDKLLIFLMFFSYLQFSAVLSNSRLTSLQFSAEFWIVFLKKMKNFPKCIR